MGAGAPDQVGERLVGEPEREDGAARGLAAPELRELPQEQEQPLLHADGVRDRGADGDPPRAAQRALGERLEQLRELPGPGT